MKSIRLLLRPSKATSSACESILKQSGKERDTRFKVKNGILGVLAKVRLERNKVRLIERVYRQLLAECSIEQVPSLKQRM